MQLVNKEGGASYYEAPKVLMPQWNDTISTNTTIHHSTNTATADACIQDFCTVLLFSYAIRSQSVLTTIGHVYHHRFKKLCYYVYRTMGNSIYFAASDEQVSQMRCFPSFAISDIALSTHVVETTGGVTYKKFIRVNAKITCYSSAATVNIILLWFSMLLFSLGEWGGCG